MKYVGKIGFVKTVETRPGVWKPETIERQYYGDVLESGIDSQNTTDLNDDIRITNKISILADSYVLENFSTIRYAEFMGSKWKVRASVNYPRIILTFGGLYNGES